MQLEPEQRSRLAALVAALRSGKYKQNHGRLKKGDRYCVWGVAYDVTGCGYWLAGRSQVQREVCSSALARMHGVEEDDLGDWARWNDELRLTFPEIADRIEAQWLAPSPEQAAAIEQVIQESTLTPAEAT